MRSKAKYTRSALKTVSMCCSTLMGHGTPISFVDTFLCMLFVLLCEIALGHKTVLESKEVKAVQLKCAQSDFVTDCKFKECFDPDFAFNNQT